MPYRNLVDIYKYKELKDPQPHPLPPGTGIVSIEHDDGVWWHPVYLARPEDVVNFEYCHDPYPGGHVFQSYKGDKGRRQAIGYLWRRWRRGDLEYSRGYQKIDGYQGIEETHWRLDYCSAGVTGNLYQHQRVTIAFAASRLALPVSAIMKIVKSEGVKARWAYLHTSKSRSRGRDYFSNYYLLSLANLEAYLDQHGYGKDYPSYAQAKINAAQDGRELPVILWCV